MLREKNTFKFQIYELIYLAIGAVPGALIRWQINQEFLVNIAGALILGIIFGTSAKKRLRLIMGVGFCGSLTTFSSWMLKSFDLILHGQVNIGIFSIVNTLFMGCIMSYLGYQIGSHLNHSKHY